MNQLKNLPCILILVCIAALGTVSFAEQATPTNLHANVVVYGGTSGGVIAAVAAARQGKSAIIINAASHIGGTTAGGLSNADWGYPEAIGGFSREYYERVGEHYFGNRVMEQRCEPHVAENIFLQMLSEENIPHFSGRTNWLESVTTVSNRITSLHLMSGQTVTGDMFIDCTYEGDLMAAAGVSWTLGREGRSQYDEVNAGVRYLSNFVPFDPYLIPGDENSGLLPFISPYHNLPIGSADNGIQTYNYRMCMSQDPTNQVPFTAPANYTPDTYELLARSIETFSGLFPNMRLQDISHIVPIYNGKTDANQSYRGIHGTSDIMGLSHSWPTNSLAGREDLAQQHKDYIQGMWYFLQTSPRVPTQVRTQANSWGLAKDEFVDNGHWPYQIYVREGRRMVSDRVITEWNFGPNSADGPSGVVTNHVALASFLMDSHGVHMLPGGQEGIIGVGPLEPVRIAYDALVPKVGEVENLFVTFALSASHAIFSCLRMEPTFMMTSQAAGTAASIAIDQSVAVQQVPYPDLEAQLRADNASLDWGPPPPDIIHDVHHIPVDFPVNGVSHSDGWAFRWDAVTSIDRTYYRDSFSPKGEGWFKFERTLEPFTRYELMTWFFEEINNDTRVPYTVTAGGTSETYIVSQRFFNEWKVIGEFETDITGNVEVLITNEGTSKHVIVDAMGYRKLNNPADTDRPFRYTPDSLAVDADTFPDKLSQTRIFADLQTMSLRPAFQPFQPAVPSWKSGAETREWFAMPDTSTGIVFNAASPWQFPEGSTWVQHFDYPLVSGQPASAIPLETRILVQGPTGISAATYRWNDEQTDADLVPDIGDQRILTITNNQVSTPFTWSFPAKADCLSCHNSNAGNLLGFTSLQLNSDISHFGMPTNQIALLDDMDCFNNPPEDMYTLRKLAPPDNLTYSTEFRARSYLHANCSHCHQPGGPSIETWDTRLTAPRKTNGLIDGLLTGPTGSVDDRVIAPGSLVHSALYTSQTNSPPRMPPQATGFPDADGVSLLAAWINELIDYQSYSNWQQTAFANPAIPQAGPMYDPDGDKMSNYQEYLFRTSPEIPDTDYRISVLMNNPHMILQYDHPPNISAVLQYRNSLQPNAPWKTLNIPDNSPVFIRTAPRRMYPSVPPLH